MKHQIYRLVKNILWLRNLAVVCFIILSICGKALAQSLSEQYEIAALEIEAIPYSEFLNSTRFYLGENYEKLSGKDWSKLEEVMSLDTTLDELIDLMQHQNPRVRTLAMLRAYKLEDRESFIAIQGRFNDTEKGIPAEDWDIKLPTKYDSLTKKWVGGSVSRLSKDVTVSEVAKDILNTVGYPPLKIINIKEPDFDEWKVSHLLNPHWVGWYIYLYRNAGGLHSNVKPKILPSKLREEIGKLDSPFREWVILHFEPGRTNLFTEEDINKSLKSLGGDNLLAYLENGETSGIDIPVEGYWSSTVKDSILKHSKSVFSPKHAKKLSDLGFYIAAADASPKKAEMYILKGIITDRDANAPWTRGVTAAALLDHLGDYKTHKITDMLYRKVSNGLNYKEHPGWTGPFGYFAEEVIIREPKQWRNTFITIANHPQFKDLSPAAVESLDKAVAHLSNRDIQKEKKE